MPLQSPEPLIKLFEKFTGRKPERLKALAESGSPRLYYRLESGQHCLVGTYNLNVEENLAFRHLSDIFRKLGLPVPAVLAMSDDRTCYLQEDLGDTSLFKLVQEIGGMQNVLAKPQMSHHRVDNTTSFNQTQQPSQSLLKYFEEAVDHLVIFQLDTHKYINYNTLKFSGKLFDLTAILDDLQYFRYYFVRLHPELGINEYQLLSDMQRFARLCARAHRDAFMYRDFQSRNIMIQDGRTYYIDFQGGKQGPLPYDIISLLWQARAGFTHEQRLPLLARYKSNVESRHPAAAKSLDDYFPLFVHLRQMQVLGAYGFRGIVQKKEHFLRSIAPAIRQAKQNLKHYPIPANLSTLQNTFERLDRLFDKYPTFDEDPNHVLQVDVFSFSYLQGGLPPDTSGNGGGFVFDCRALPNPGREAHLRALTGLDAEIINYFKAIPEVQQFINIALQLANQAINEYLRRRFTRLSIGFGCTGGRHRSVYCAETLTNSLQQQFPEVVFKIRHHNIET